MATRADLAEMTQRNDIVETLGSLVANDGSAAHGYAQGESLRHGRDAARNLADAVHYLCVLHGRLPGVIELAAGKTLEPEARAWFAEAADSFVRERSYLTKLTVAAGPIPSTPGQAECEAAVIGQRHALEILAQSDRVGCALGAAAALILDWRAIRKILDFAALRLNIPPTPAKLPGTRDTLALIARIAQTSAIERAVAFGAQQILAQHRGLWNVLEARQAARSEH